MAAHRFWRIRVLKDSNFFANPNYYLNVAEMGFYDAAMTRLAPVEVTSSGYFGNYPPSQAFDNNTSTLASLDMNMLRSGAYAFVTASYAAPVSAVFFKYRPDSTNCPLDFTIDWSDDGIVWVQSIRHTMAQVTTESIFPTGSRVAGSAAGAYPMWRIRMTVDTGSQTGSRHYQNFKQVRFINQIGNVVPVLASFSSGYDSAIGTPTNAFSGAQTRIYTDALYDGTNTACYLGMSAAAEFRPTKLQFIMQSGTGSQNSNASFVLEGSTNGKTWFQEAEYINQPFVADSLMDFAVAGSLNTDMTMKKLSELPYTELTASQAKDALIPLSGIGDEVDTLYRVSLADLAAMLVNAEAVGTDYHKEHRGWRIIFAPSNVAQTQTIGDLSFLDRAGNAIPATGGTPYTFNGDSNIANNGGANAFDGNPATIASSGADLGPTGNATQPYGVGYIFASPQDVGSIKITPATGYIANAPKAFAIQYSDDGGISWTSFASFESVTGWATGVSKQFYLPSAGIATSGINYGKDFWRSVDFTTTVPFDGGRMVYPSSQIVTGAAPGRRLVVEAMLLKVANGSSELYIGNTSGTHTYSIAAQGDSNFVTYSRVSGVRAAMGISGSPTTGSDAIYDYAGYYHLKLEINIGDIASQRHAISAWVNGYSVPFYSSAAINLSQDLKIYVDGPPNYDGIKWVHYRWDDNGLDIPVLAGGSTGGSDGGTGGGETVVVGGSPTRYYRLGGFTTLSPQANETLVLNAVADPFVFGAGFLGSYGKAVTPPLATFVCSVRKNNVAIGTMTVSTAGVVTFATTGNAAVLVAAGDVISVVAPGAPDTGITNFAFTLVGVTNTTAVYVGARVKRTTSMADATGNRLVAWQAKEHDDGGFWNINAADRFVVPAGVTKVRVQAGILFTNANAGTTAFAAILKNSTDPFIVDMSKLVSMSKATSSAFDGAAINVDSGVISVVEGDYFTLTVNTGGDTAAGVDSNGSFFAIEAADGSALLSGEPDIFQPTPLLVTPTYRFGFFFDYAPEANERLGIHIASDAFTFADDFSGSIGFVEVPPAATYTMLVKKNNVDIGTVVVTTTGAATFNTIGTTVSVAIGDRISLIAPAGKDTVIAGGAFTFKGTF